jgi:hypothetical protein
MKTTLYIFFIFLSTGLTSCILSKKAIDKSVTKYVINHTVPVNVAAKFSVSITYNKSKKDFLAIDILDKKMRKNTSLGVSVYVDYENKYFTEIPDSSVTFKTMGLFGVSEIIYDFVVAQRTFADNTENSKEYCFIKLGDRIYYRRRPIPMM